MGSSPVLLLRRRAQLTGGRRRSLSAWCLTLTILFFNAFFGLLLPDGNLLIRGVATLILSAPLLWLYARAKRSVLPGELRKSVVTGKPTQHSSKCRQSAVTLHPEPTRVDTTRHEPTTVSSGILGNYRPRSRPAWFF